MFLFLQHATFSEKAKKPAVNDLPSITQKKDYRTEQTNMTTLTFDSKFNEFVLLLVCVMSADCVKSAKEFAKRNK